MIVYGIVFLSTLSRLSHSTSKDKFSLSVNFIHPRVQIVCCSFPLSIGQRSTIMLTGKRARFGGGETKKKKKRRDNNFDRAFRWIETNIEWPHQANDDVDRFVKIEHVPSAFNQPDPI